MAKAHATPDRVSTSWRVRFAYRGDDIRPVAAEQVRMIAPGGARVPREEQDKRSGSYVEVIAGGGRDARWSRAIAQPNRADRELFLEDGGVTRIDAPPEGEFELIIPDYGPDATFVLYASPAKAPEQAAKARTKLRLADLERLGSGRPVDDVSKA